VSDKRATDREVLTPVPSGLPLANLWVTDSYPLGFSFKRDTTDKYVGISPPENGPQLGVVEVPPLEPAKCCCAAAALAPHPDC
jgi:hypothetical protein